MSPVGMGRRGVKHLRVGGHPALPHLHSGSRGASGDSGMSGKTVSAGLCMGLLREGEPDSGSLGWCVWCDPRPVGWSSRPEAVMSSAVCALGAA